MGAKKGLKLEFVLRLFFNSNVSVEKSVNSISWTRSNCAKLRTWNAGSYLRIPETWMLGCGGCHTPGAIFIAWLWAVPKRLVGGPS